MSKYSVLLIGVKTGAGTILDEAIKKGLYKESSEEIKLKSEERMKALQELLEEEMPYKEERKLFTRSGGTK